MSKETWVGSEAMRVRDEILKMEYCNFIWPALEEVRKSTWGRIHEVAADWSEEEESYYEDYGYPSEYLDLMKVLYILEDRVIHPKYAHLYSGPELIQKVREALNLISETTNL